MPRFQRTIVGDFSGGWVTAASPFHIPINAVTECENADMFSLFGSVRRRHGTAVYVAPGPSSPQTWVPTLYEYIYQSGGSTVKKIIASNYNSIYEVSNPNWVSIYTSSYNGNHVPMVTFTGKLIFLDVPGLPPRAWSGSGSTIALGGSPPTDGVAIEIYRSRVFIASKNRIYYSKIDDPNDWTSEGENGAGSFTVAQDDGDEIVRLVAFNTVLFIFKTRSIYVLTGSKPSNFTVRNFAGGVGAIAPQSVVKAEAFILFLSRIGVHAIGDDTFAILSKQVEPTIHGIANKDQCVAGVFGNQYWLSVNEGGPSLRQVYVLDYVKGIWSRYNNIYGRSFLYSSDGSWLIGRSNSVKVVSYASGYDDDEGVSIPMSFRTKELWTGGWDTPKGRIISYLAWRPIAETIGLSLFVNGAEVGSSSIAPTIGTGIYRVNRADLLPTTPVDARTVSIKVSTTWDKPTIYGLSVEMEELERGRP